MDFHYSELTDTYLPSAYERLLLDCMLGQPMLYARGDALEACWEYVAPVLAAWEADPTIKLYGYPAGTWGPWEADDLLAQSGLQWRFPCRNISDDGLYCEL
jgi:glucose-6-phosphate 1-dehydrogenase